MSNEYDVSDADCYDQMSHYERAEMLARLRRRNKPLAHDVPQRSCVEVRDVDLGGESNRQYHPSK